MDIADFVTSTLVLSIGIPVALVVLVLVLAMRQAKRKGAALGAVFANLGLSIASHTPRVATGAVDGVPVTYEEFTMRSPASRGGGVHPSARIRATGPTGRVPDSALVARGWEGVGVERPSMRVVPTGDPALDASFETFANDDASVARWRSAMADPAFAGLVHSGQLREVHMLAGQAVVVISGFAPANVHERAIRVASGLASGRIGG